MEGEGPRNEDLLLELCHTAEAPNRHVRTYLHVCMYVYTPTYTCMHNTPPSLLPSYMCLCFCIYRLTHSQADKQTTDSCRYGHDIDINTNLGAHTCMHIAYTNMHLQCIYIYIYIYVIICRYVNTHVYRERKTEREREIYIYICMYVIIYPYLYTYIHTYIPTYIHTYIHAYMYIYLCSTSTLKHQYNK